MSVVFCELIAKISVREQGHHTTENKLKSQPSRNILAEVWSWNLDQSYIKSKLSEVICVIITLVSQPFIENTLFLEKHWAFPVFNQTDGVENKELLWDNFDLLAECLGGKSNKRWDFQEL